MITTTDFPKLTDDLEAIFDETKATKIAEMGAKLVFDIFDNERLTYESLNMHGVSGIEKVAEGQDLPKLNSNEGDTISSTQSYYGAIVPITKKMRKFDLHDQIDSTVRTVVEDAFDKIDQSLADVLGFGASTSYTDVYGESVTSVGPDGLALFSTAHTNNVTSATFSNTINDGSVNNPTIARAAIINEQATGATFTDVNGLTRPIQLDAVLVAPKNTDQADRIINSNQIDGSANNDKNSLKGKVEAFTWSRLQTATGSNDRSNYWYMFSKAQVKKALKAIFAERPSLDAPEQVYTNKNWEYSIDFYYSIQRVAVQFIRQSSAVGS